MITGDVLEKLYLDFANFKGIRAKKFISCSSYYAQDDRIDVLDENDNYHEITVNNDDFLHFITSNYTISKKKGFIIKSTKNIHIIHNDGKFVFISINKRLRNYFDNFKFKVFDEFVDESIKFPKGSFNLCLLDDALLHKENNQILKRINMTHSQFSEYITKNNITNTDESCNIYLIVIGHN